LCIASFYNILQTFAQKNWNVVKEIYNRNSAGQTERRRNLAEVICRLADKSQMQRAIVAERVLKHHHNLLLLSSNRPPLPQQLMLLPRQPAP
jgi:hypothetical protein